MPTIVRNQAPTWKADAVVNEAFTTISSTDLKGKCVCTMEIACDCTVPRVERLAVLPPYVCAAHDALQTIFYCSTHSTGALSDAMGPIYVATSNATRS